MFNHEPKDYTCPFCLLVHGGEGKYNSQQDIIYQDKLVTAFTSPRWWPNNPGNVIIVPNQHFEHIYDLPAKYAHRVQDIAKEVAIAFKEIYKCDGVSHANITNRRVGKTCGIITFTFSLDMKVTICI